MENFGEREKKRHCVFVSAEELWDYVRKSGVTEKYITIVQDMFALE